MIISVNGIDEVKDFPVSLCDSIILMDYSSNTFYVKTHMRNDKVKIGVYKFQPKEIIYV